MSVRATIATSYRARLGIIALALIGFAGWAAYDGFVKYPKLKDRYDRYVEVSEQHPKDYQQVWQEVAAENGWPTDTPSKKTQQSIFTQYVIMGITLPLGLYFAFVFIRAGGRWVEATPDALTTHDGKRATWDEIKNIDKTRWKSKGIAVVEYDDNGETKRITLDDWKFDREPTASILAEVEARTGLGGGDEGDAQSDAQGDAQGDAPDEADATAADAASAEDDDAVASDGARSA